LGGLGGIVMENLLVKNFADETKKVIRIATHPGWDADNVAGIPFVLMGLLGEEYDRLLNEGWGVEVVHTSKAGEYLPGCINIDTGADLVITPNKVVIDHHQDRGLRNSLDAALHIGLHLDGLEFLVPLLDNPAAVPLDHLSMLHRQVVELYANEGQYEKYMAHLIRLENRPLDPGWFDEEDSPEWGDKIRELVKNFQEERLAAEAALDRGERIGDLLLVREFVPNGAALAYARGTKYYLSISPHKKGGCTFSLTGKELLPEDLLKIARELKGKFPEAVYISSKGDMVIVGGPKAPEVKLPEEVVEEMVAAIKVALL
jgi:hypothetical protein